MNISCLFVDLLCWKLEKCIINTSFTKGTEYNKHIVPIGGALLIQPIIRGVKRPPEPRAGGFLAGRA